MWLGMRLRQILPTIAAAVILTGCASTPPQPIPSFEAHDISIMVTGDAVMATTQVRAIDGFTTPDTVGLCAVDQFAREYEWPLHPVKLTPAWSIVTSVRRFPPGEYTARVCITANSQAQRVTGAVESFSVH